MYIINYRLILSLIIILEMLNPNDSIFKYEDWLDNNEGEPSYNYYVEITKKRKEILSVMWTPYFEEIRQRTKGIQDKLKKEWYEDIDLQLKSLFIDWIEFFLNSDSEEPQLDNKKWLYLKGLFYSLMINTENKKLLNNILSELKKWWKKLPQSPINFLIDYKEQNPIENNRTKEGPGLNMLGRNSSFTKRTILVEDILKTLRGSIEKMDHMRTRSWRLEWKRIMPWHYAYDDSKEKVKLLWENVVIYSVWDEYIPSSNHWNSIELLDKINNASEEQIEKLYEQIHGKENLNWRKHRYKDNSQKYIRYFKQSLSDEFIDFIAM